MHLVITMAIRGYLSYAIHNAQPKWCNICLTKGRLTLLLLIIPIITGLLHSYFFDDKKLYKFGNSDVGSTCQLGFGISSTLGTVYLMYGVVQQRIADVALQDSIDDARVYELLKQQHTNIGEDIADAQQSPPAYRKEESQSKKATLQHKTTSIFWVD